MNRTPAKMLLLADVREFSFANAVFILIIVSHDWGFSCEIALRWMPLYLTDDKSTSVQVMAGYQVNIGSGNGWVPSGNKPSYEPML